MTNYLYSNGTFFDTSQPAVYAQNRAFHFGDGFFDTIRAVNGKPIFLAEHFSRVLESMAAFKMDQPEDFNLEKLRSEIIGLLEKNEIKFGGRIRVTYSRRSSGFYLPHSHDVDYIIEAYPLEDNYFELNTEGKKVEIFPDMKKQIHAMAMFKTLNCQVYIMGSLYAKEKEMDDALIQNYRNNIIEATSSNLFIVSNGVLYTSGLEDGCVAGIMRMQIINLAIENQIKVYECTLSPQHLMAADQIFLTNAIRGIQWVSSYRTKRYFNETSRKLVGMLNSAL